MFKRSHRSIVNVLSGGLGLSLAACGGNEASIPVGTSNPPGPPASAGLGSLLPPWEQIDSGHPEGATPSSPVLVVMADGPRCWKEWVGGMAPPSDEVRQLGRPIITDPAQTKGTEIACPRRKAQAVLDTAAALEEPVPAAKK